MGYIDHVFDVKQMCEKHIANGKYVFPPLMNLEITYEHRHDMWMCMEIKVNC